MLIPGTYLGESGRQRNLPSRNSSNFLNFTTLPPKGVSLVMLDQERPLPGSRAIFPIVSLANYNFGAKALPARAIVCFAEIEIMASIFSERGGDTE